MLGSAALQAGPPLEPPPAVAAAVRLQNAVAGADGGRPDGPAVRPRAGVADRRGQLGAGGDGIRRRRCCRVGNLEQNVRFDYHLRQSSS